MQGTVTISLTEYNSMRDSITELQSQVEKYAEQIQKEQLNSTNIKELLIDQFMELPDDPHDDFIMRNVRRNVLINDCGITNEEIDAYLVNVNT